MPAATRPGPSRGPAAARTARSRVRRPTEPSSRPSTRSTEPGRADPGELVEDLVEPARAEVGDRAGRDLRGQRGLERPARSPGRRDQEARHACAQPVRLGAHAGRCRAQARAARADHPPAPTRPPCWRSSRLTPSCGRVRVGDRVVGLEPAHRRAEQRLVAERAAAARVDRGAHVLGPADRQEVAHERGRQARRRSAPSTPRWRCSRGRARATQEVARPRLVGDAHAGSASLPAGRRAAARAPPRRRSRAARCGVEVERPVAAATGSAARGRAAGAASAACARPRRANRHWSRVGLDRRVAVDQRVRAARAARPRRRAARRRRRPARRRGPPRRPRRTATAIAVEASACARSRRPQPPHAPARPRRPRRSRSTKSITSGTPSSR